ncbi:hypothetical protein B0J13DRAFT_660004 [Dactylonectria estremocensis]|uniref:FAD-binding PCMH-type domain-containing protein n=1 Tax=Dactylonectria estremocensis TaxID=1079267 RepID=A0A9P9I879_9HYPO|nr:hypothetical protein B0J13DRAFT_660004 [Dactylonectria estremocensis]
MILPPATEAQNLTPSSEGYEKSRLRYVNGRVPNNKPAEIFSPITTVEVAEKVRSAAARGLKLGVRSGGHLFPCSSLLGGGLLIDTHHLNKDFGYDPVTKIISFGPGGTVKEVARNLLAINRFFPHGHCSSVGAGGFYLAGGQGCFIRGWGLSCVWVTQIEVVTAKGEVVIANRDQNADLFWAAPGSGQGFFGVLTRIWARTIPASKLFDTTIILDATDEFDKILKWAFKTGDKVPKYGTDVTYTSAYSDRDAPDGGELSQTNRRLFIVNVAVYSDTIDQAKVVTSPFDVIPDDIKSHVAMAIPLGQRTWEEMWTVQDSVAPYGNGERYRVDNILIGPDTPFDEIIDRIKPALYDLPTRLSCMAVYALDCSPDESEQAASLPQKYCVTTLACWKDPTQDKAMDRRMQAIFAEAEKASTGSYVADFDITQRVTKIMTDTALTKWLEIRQKWDPEESFIGYRGFVKTLGHKPRI